MINKKTDVLVIGAGLSGLMAAAAAARLGKKVMVAARGMGAVCLSSGCIDLWGYSPERPEEVSCSPLEDIARWVESNPDHPYARVIGVLEESLEFFQGVCLESGIPYIGNDRKNWLIPTALGTVRPSFLAPASMAVSSLAGFKRIIVVGFSELKDFQPQVMAANLGRNAGLPPDCPVQPVTISAGGGEPGPVALARRLDSPGMIEKVVAQVKSHLSSGCALLFPAVLGDRRDTEVSARLAGSLGCPVFEVAGVPPSLPGLRLQRALLANLKNSGVEVILGCEVTDFHAFGGQCLHVKTTGVPGLQIEAESFVLATGSFVGGGLEALPGEIKETVFNLPVKADSTEWTARDFLSLEGQPFSRFGIEVNELLQPVDSRGRMLLSNVMVAGSNISGCNYPLEKCGSGVAVATGYLAGKLAGRRGGD